MTTEYTDLELREFNSISMQCASRNQMTRITGRLRMRELISKHGKEKCDAMWAEIQRAEKELKDKTKRKGKRK